MPRTRALRACIFDAYGTLLDLNSALRGTEAMLGVSGPQLLATWRAKQLEYSWVRSLSEDYQDFWRCTCNALAYALDLHRVDGSVQQHLLENYETLQCYPGVAETLLKIRDAGAKTMVLSNGTKHMVERAIQPAGLEALVDLVVSADEVRTYKPDPAVYELARTRLGLPASEIDFVSANAWDIAGAMRAGFRTVWINRDNRPGEYGLAGNSHFCKSLREAAHYLIR